MVQSETPVHSQTNAELLNYTLPGFLSFVVIVYYYSVLHFGDYQGLDVAIPELGVHILLSRVVVTISQLFFTYRLYVFSNHNIPITIVSIVLSLYHFGLSIMVSTHFIQTKRYSELSLLVILYLLYSGAIAGDMFLTVALYLFLKTQKTQFTKTRSVINEIIMLSFQTSFFTTALAVVSIVILGHVGLGILYALTLPAAQLYLLSVVVTLNSRSGFAKTLAASSDKSFAATRLPAADSETVMQMLKQNNIFNATPLEGVGVRIDRVVFTDVEAAPPANTYSKFANVRAPGPPKSNEKIFSSTEGSQTAEKLDAEPLYPPCQPSSPLKPRFL
ncbi:uncharacterized protein MELLADRAFT_78729 [Melampsora larici-populina 98AG31]|uniref:DUF6534 domain-containing protein n=1 Tax=Melampsora larici-populina (strain 98AG31 / pathotype 3-4-7) TaxID=747676 RepID=F4RXZ2_MELLP|nr:uncharacterized protein MELLADRAFT_78729 [Melampsora larici-populina 98AG31]EGG02819.1 hypothetical protein MELLADRAFT_78729 [Melampsora larici-populina 98AG31]